MASQEKKRRPGRPRNPIGRPKLIELARGIFASSGYAGSTLSQVAEKTGLRKASLYHHFATKEDLYMTVMDEVISQFREVFMAALTGTGTFTDRLTVASEAATAFLASTPDAAKLLNREIVESGPYWNAHGATALTTTLSLVVTFFEAGMAAGEFRQQNAKHLVLMVTGICLFNFSAIPLNESLLGEDYAAETQKATTERILQLVIK